MTDFEKKSEELIKTNEEYLKIFKNDLENSNLSPKTIRSHLANANFYINEFLVRSLLPMACGVEEIGSYLGDFFIRKCMWSTPGTIKTTAASIKKFYKCMLENGKIDKEDYEELCYRIKCDMEDWQRNCAIFNDPEDENPFMWY